jgi:carbonic anhydrase/acetyltransferase-like protein (isoleucine patch superfamily)
LTTELPEGSGTRQVESESDSALVRSFGSSRPRIHQAAWLAPGSVVVGDVEIGADSSLWYGVVARGDVHSIRIGARTNIQDNSVLHVTQGRHACILGDEITVGHRAVVHGCTIGDGALVGIGAIVLDGARVGEGALVGAGALVPPGAQIPDRSLVLGIPGRVVRLLSDVESATQLERTLAYVQNARAHAASGTCSLQEVTQ